MQGKKGRIRISCETKDHANLSELQPFQGDLKTLSSYELDKLRNNTSEGQVVYDPFCGSGTTLIAAQMLKRKCAAIELSPEYADIIIARWEEYTGEEARHA